MISFSGMSTSLALRVVDRVKDQQIESIQNTKVNALEIEKFKSEASKVKSADDLIENYDVYSFMMKAYDLEEKIYAKALMKKILESDLNDPESLVNRISDPKIKELAKVFNFEDGGTTNVNTSSQEWIDTQLDEYLNTKFINQNRQSNESLGVVLKVRDKVEDLTDWIAVLGDLDLGDFMRTALGVPSQVALLDIDKQVEIFEKRFDVEKLQDPEELDQLINRYIIFKDSESSQAAFSASPILQIIGGGSGDFLPITIDIQAVSRFNPGAYR